MAVKFVGFFANKIKKVLKIRYLCFTLHTSNNLTAKEMVTIKLYYEGHDGKMESTYPRSYKREAWANRYKKDILNILNLIGSGRWYVFSEVYD